MFISCLLVACVAIRQSVSVCVWYSFISITYVLSLFGFSFISYYVALLGNYFCRPKSHKHLVDFLLFFLYCSFVLVLFVPKVIQTQIEYIGPNKTLAVWVIVGEVSEMTASLKMGSYPVFLCHTNWWIPCI